MLGFFVVFLFGGFGVGFLHAVQEKKEKNPKKTNKQTNNTST